MTKPSRPGRLPQAFGRRGVLTGGGLKVGMLLGVALATVWTFSSPEQQDAALNAIRKLGTAAGLAKDSAPAVGEGSNK